MPQISVIVPVYKVEQYLPACVDSILAQTFPDYELILVDDGSPDGCGALCDAYAEDDSRIRVIHRENGGLSAARNSGLDAAVGTYIAFVDSDDAIAPNFLQAMLDAAVSAEAAVSCCKFTEFRQKLPKKDFAATEKTTVMTGREACISVYNASAIFTVTACGKLFRKDTISKDRFPEGKLHEDQFFVPVVLYRAEAVAVLNAGLYWYRLNTESITHSQFNLRRFDNLEGIDRCIAQFQTLGDKELTAAAKKARRRIRALSNLLSIHCGIHAKVPKEYRISKYAAVRDCFLYSNRNTCSWYLSLLYPTKTRLIDISLKLKSIFLHN